MLGVEDLKRKLINQFLRRLVIIYILFRDSIGERVSVFWKGIIGRGNYMGKGTEVCIF